MIKDFSINKIVVASVSLLLLLLFYFFPSSDNLDINYEIKYEEPGNKESVYLMDKSGYVAKLDANIASLNKEDIVYKKLEILRLGDKNNESFIPLIPKNVKINYVKLEDNKVTVDFSKEILEVNSEFEEKMIEAIVFSLTEIEGIDEVYLKVDGTLFNELPSSKEIIDYPLTRDYGINKEYDITKPYNISRTTIYFIKEDEDLKYYVPVTKVTNSNLEKIDIIINELKSSVNYQSNLNSYLSNNLKLDDYTVTEEAVNLIFNEYIFEDLNEENILEEVKYTISASILENYDVKEVVFSTIDKKNIETFSVSNN